jgi:predicted TPR repeat methyltransferase
MLLTMMHAMETEPVADLPSLVRNGPPRENADFGTEEIWAGYARAMANYQRSGMAQKMAVMVEDIPGFASWKKMLDLGGGPGLFCIAMVSRHPSLQGVVFDQPAVAAVAETFIAEYELQDRIRAVGGDYVNDPIGDGYDLVWASATLNFVRGNLVPFLEKIYRAMAPGGVFVSLAEGMTAERTEPASMVLGTLSHGLMGQDFLFDAGEIARAMNEAGFSSVRSIPVETSMVPMVLDIATKECD